MNDSTNMKTGKPLQTLLNNNANIARGGTLQQNDPSETIEKAHLNANKGRLSVERIYQKKTQLEHILLRPDTYIGSVEPVTQPMWVYDGESEGMVHREITFVPGLYKIFDEILVNAADNKQRDSRMDCIKIDIDPENNVISVYNNGKGIPIVEHKVEKMFVPSLIFGQLLTSSNYNDEEKKVTGGRNGYGAKLCNIFSTKFVVETACKESKSSFRQAWSGNMSNAGEPRIKPYSGEDYTKITFSPDLSKFKMTTLDKDLVALLSRRAYDVAGSSKGVKVFLNGKRLPIKGFKDYVEQYLKGKEDEQGNPLKVVHEVVNERWEVAVTLSDKGFQQVSFVNSIATTKGGRHVDYVADQIVTKLIETVKKKNKGGVAIKPFQIKTHMWIFVNCLIENPTFDSQTKENMTLQAKSFGSKCQMGEKFINQVQKCGIVESILTWMRFKQQNQLASKCSKSKHSKLKGIPKLEDANQAGTRYSTECTLILTEGDSAKTLAVSGLAVVGRDNYGVFPLRGKMLNVREATHKQILENAEINNIIKIMGLQYKKKYESEEDLKTLRYGKLMIMTDQDQDGSHIKGLLINFIHHNWPSLLQLPFLEEFITPIVKVKKGNQERSFYSLPEFEEWKTQTENWNTWKVKYYKGLGTSTSKEAKEYFSDMLRHRILFKYAGPDDDNAIQLAFSKKMIEQRKEWLTNGMEERKQRKELGLPEMYLYGKETKHITYQEFVNKELILFSNMDNERSIPNVIDGLKPGQRKVLFTCFKRNDKKEIKVAQLAGSVAEHSAYHHGEQSLMSTIINLAQNFVGSNNINLLQPIGQFGTRLQGGKDAASPRYIFTMLSPLARHIFNVQDEPLLNYLNEDNQRIEPDFYIPIIPMVLVNGADGIGTGWMTRIHNYNPREIITNIKRLIAGEEPTKMVPWFKNFKGTIDQIDLQRFVVNGEVGIMDEKTIEVSELPIRVWTQVYKESTLEPMLYGSEKTPPIITDYKEYHTDTTVRFVVSMSEEKLKQLEIEGLHRALKLQTTLASTSMVCFDHNGCLRKYETVEDILKEFYTVRLDFYEKRKSYLEGMLNAEASKLSNQARFILEKIEGKLVIENKRKQDMIDELVKKGYEPDPVKSWNKLKQKDVAAEEEESDSESENQITKSEHDYDYLLGMSMWWLTREKKEELLKQKERKVHEYEVLQKKTPTRLWLDDLDALLKELDKVEALERQDELSGVVNKPIKPGKVASGRARVKKLPSEETKPSPQAIRIVPKIDPELKRKVEKAAQNSTGAKRARKKEEAKNETKELTETDSESKSVTDAKKKKAMKQSTLTFLPTKKEKKSPKKLSKKNPWSDSESGSDSDDGLREALSKLPRDKMPRRAASDKAKKYNFDSDSNMSEEEKEENFTTKDGSDLGSDDDFTDKDSNKLSKVAGGNTTVSSKSDADSDGGKEEKDSSKDDHVLISDTDSDIVSSKLPPKKKNTVNSNTTTKKATTEKKDNKQKSAFDSLIEESKKNSEETKKSDEEEAEEPDDTDEDKKSDISDVEVMEKEEPKKAAPKKRGRKKESSDISEDEFSPKKKKSTAARKPPGRKRKVVNTGGSDSDDDGSSYGDKKKTTTAKRKKKPAGSSDDENGEQDPNVALRARSARSRAPVRYNFGEDSEDDEY